MRDRGRGAVVQVDRHQEQSEEKTKSAKILTLKNNEISPPARDRINSHSKADPADHDHQEAGDEVGEGEVGGFLSIFTRNPILLLFSPVTVTLFTCRS